MSHGDTQLSWEPAPGHGPEVLYAVDGPLGRVRLNRPRAINALDRATIDSLHQQLTAWVDDDRVGGILLDGAGDRGLCAGGDVRALREAVLAGRQEEAVDYWRAEYAVNALVASYPKPYVAWMDGIVMGGGGRRLRARIVGPGHRPHPTRDAGGHHRLLPRRRWAAPPGSGPR